MLGSFVRQAQLSLCSGLLHVRCCGACAQIVLAVMHLGRLGLASNALSVLVAFQVLLLWIKAQLLC